MEFSSHETGDWSTTVDAGPVQVDSRPHSLFFLIEDAELLLLMDGFHALSVCSAVNAAEFLGVDAGLLLCEGVHLDSRRRTGVPGRQLVWCLRYDFIENAAQRWDEILVPIAGGKMKRTTIDEFPAVDFAAFFKDYEGLLGSPVPRPDSR